MPHYYAPRIELLPLKAGVSASQDSEVTVLARIFAASAPPPESRRPPLNLSLVIDRSGSMQGQPIEMARRAVQLALRMMQPQDRVSVVSFDGHVETVVARNLWTTHRRCASG